MARRPKKSTDNVPSAFEESPDTDIPEGSVDTPGSIPFADPVETPALFRKVAPAAEQEPQKAAGELSLAGMDIRALLGLRGRIDALLPPGSLSQMNLEEELIRQYQLAKEMVRIVSKDELVPANQRAQVANSCAAMLKTLADMQTSVYTSERVKAIEAAIEKAFAGETPEVKRAFYERYARLVREAIDQKDVKNQAVFEQNVPKMT